MADFLEDKRKEIQARLKELKPLIAEYERLEAAERALAGVEGTPAGSGSGRGSGGSTSRSAPRRRRSGGSASTGRRGRPKGSGTRSIQALELVRARPGITI